MKSKLHYLLMADHTTMQKQIFANIRHLGLTPGQPKVLDYLQKHNGAIQKDIASGCYIEPASLSNILCGMEKTGLIERKTGPDSRRNVNVYMTEKGEHIVRVLNQEIEKIETKALSDFSKDDIEILLYYLEKIHKNMELTNEYL